MQKKLVFFTSVGKNAFYSMDRTLSRIFLRINGRLKIQNLNFHVNVCEYI